MTSMTSRARAGVLGLALAATALTGCSTADPDAPPDPSWSVPCPKPDSGAQQAADFADLTLPCLGDESEYPIGTLNSRPLVITLWASWCKPCADEAPALQQTVKELGDQIDIIGVDTQDTRDKGRFFAEDFKWTFPSVFDESGQVLRSQGLPGLPATFVIAPDGTTAKTFSGGDLTAEELIDAVNQTLEEAP